MIGLHDKVIDEDLQYKYSEDNMVYLHHGRCGLIKAFKAYYTQFITNLHCNLIINWTEFDQFYISPSFVSSSSLSPNKQITIASSSQEPVHEFKKGIKLVPSALTELNEDKKFDQWYHSTWALALAKDASEILDTAYKPSNKQETELFEEKQKYMFAVF